MIRNCVRERDKGVNEIVNGLILPPVYLNFFCIYTLVKVVYIYFINLMLRNGRRPKAISSEPNYRLVSP